jgi:trk system potassium uptake protein TrkH
MWVRFRIEDVRTIGHYLGVLVLGMAIAMFAPLVTAILLREWDPALDYLLGIGVACIVGALLTLVDPKPAQISHRQALLIAALGWLTVSLVSALPLALSGNYKSYLDATFDVISGLTTSGLTVVVDLDHMAYAHNMWRHLTHLIGGQGIVVAALSLAVGLRSGAFSLYVAEGRDEKIMPNVIHTARFIWFVTAVFVAAGTCALAVTNLVSGMNLVRATLQGFWMTVAAYDTGGFAPQSMNALYYHSGTVEFITLILMLAGMLNFNLHADMWRGDYREVGRNLETRTLAINIAVLSVLAGVGLVAGGVFHGASSVVFKGVYHVISAHTGTGHQTVYAAQWRSFGGAAFLAVILAMAAGGSASSTAGGIKALRLGLIFKSVITSVRRAISPDSAYVQGRYHHVVRQVLTPEVTANAMMVFILYMVTYVSGGIIGAAYGYNAGDAMCESVSATANVGLSTGITNHAMPVGLKIAYMVQMWAGRLEFIAALALIFAIVTSLRPKRRTISR